MIFKREIPAEHSIKVKVRNRLRAVSSDELIRWADNIHTTTGLSIQEMRKSLSNKEQALIHVHDLKAAALSLLAAAETLEERLTSKTE